MRSRCAPPFRLPLMATQSASRLIISRLNGSPAEVPCDASPPACRRRTARGRCGSLFLHRSGLAAPSSPASRRTVTVIRAAPFVKQRDRTGSARAWSLKLLIDTYIAIRARVGSRQPATGSAGNDGGSWVAMLAITSRRKARRWLCVALGLPASSVSVFDAPARADPMALWQSCTTNACRMSRRARAETLRKRRSQRRRERESRSSRTSSASRRCWRFRPGASRDRKPTDARADAPRSFSPPGRPRPLVEARLHHALPREAIAIAINSEWARTQDQLHLHVDCVAKSVDETLADDHSSLDDAWRAMTIALNGRIYLGRRLDSPISATSRRYACSPTASKAQARTWTPIAWRRSARPLTESPASSCSPTSFRSKAAATPKTCRTTIARSPVRRHELPRPAPAG